MDDKLFEFVMAIVTIVIVTILVVLITSNGKMIGDEGFIDRMVESGQDRYGNCYLYAKTWQWMERVPCDRIGKGG